MTDTSMIILLWSAFSVGLIHTLIGPDHYLPFIVLSKARKWSVSRAMTVTVICGLGHILSSVVIGVIGIGVGIAAGKLNAIEGIRGNVASYAMIAFGVGYGIWGLWHGLKRHGRSHQLEREHLDKSSTSTVTFWGLFIIFILGPCEPLIPILMFPAVSHNWYGIFLVTLVFGVTTILTMSALVFTGIKGLTPIKISYLEKYIHALAGAVIAVSGTAIRIFGI